MSSFKKKLSLFLIFFLKLSNSPIKTNEKPLFDGSLSGSIQYMTDWRHSRYGLSSPKPFSQKISRSIRIVLKNKMNFLILILAYLSLQTLGNAALLILRWYVENITETPNSYFVLIQLTADLPVRIFHSLLNMLVLHVLMKTVKRRGHVLCLSDLIDVSCLLKPKLILSMILSDILLSSPFAIAQVLFEKDVILALIYLAFGFFLNWIFGLAPILMMEDPNISILTAHIWSAHSSFHTSMSSVFLCTLFIFILTPFVIFTPLNLILQLLTFYEIFGFYSASEVHFTIEDR